MFFSTQFRIRTYGRTELALAYNPHLSPSAAWEKLKLWLALNPRLSHLLDAPRPPLRPSRSFTPRQVALIVSELGEP